MSEQKESIELGAEFVTKVHKLAPMRRSKAIEGAVARAKERHSDQPDLVEEAKKQAELRNWLPNHEKGVAAEYAVYEWLSRQGVRVVPNFEDIDLDLSGAPDLLVGEKQLKVDVKATDCEFPESQVWSIDNKEVVIWCDVEEIAGPDGYSTALFRVSIRGWSEISDIKATKPQKVDARIVRRVDEDKVFSASRFLERSCSIGSGSDALDASSGHS